MEILDMMNLPWYVKWALGALIATGLLWKLLKGNVRSSARWAVRKLMDKSVVVRELLKKHKDAIQELLDEVEAGVKEGIELEEKEDQSLATDSKAPARSEDSKGPAEDAARGNQAPPPSV